MGGDDSRLFRADENSQTGTSFPEAGTSYPESGTSLQRRSYIVSRMSRAPRYAKRIAGAFRIASIV
jgi:hypothetical protein